MLRWILWIIIITWLFLKLKDLFIFKQSKNKKSIYNGGEKTELKNKVNKTKTLKDNAGDYIDYEELN